METPVADNLTPATILNFEPKAKALLASSDSSALNPYTASHAIAVVSEIKNGLASHVTLHDTRYPVLAYLSALPGLAQHMQLGERVFISTVAGETGVVILGFVMTASSPALASLSLQNGKLVIEAQGAVILKSGTSTVELSEAGEIRIHGQNVRSVASDTLTLLGGNVNLN